MTDRELMQQAADVLQAVRDTPASKDEIQRAWIVSDLLKRRLAQPEQEPETLADGQRLDWLEKAADARKVELARSLYKTGYEIGEWPSLRVTVANGSLREAIDAAMQGR